MPGGGQQQTTMSASPWGPATGQLKQVALPAVRKAYERGAFGEAGVMPAGAATRRGEAMMMDAGRDMRGMLRGARGTLDEMMDGGGVYRNLDAVRSNALGAALPAVMSQFAGDAGENTLMADAAARAATEAVAPIEYGAWDAAQGRRLAAAGMAPAIGQAAFMPGQMAMGVGQQRDMRTQNNSAAATDLRNLQGYLPAIGGLGGLGGMQTQTQPGTSPFSAAAGAGLTGAGVYGTLAGAGLGGPVGMGIGGGIGLLSLLGAL